MKEDVLWPFPITIILYNNFVIDQFCRSNRIGKCIVLRWNKWLISWAGLTGAWRSCMPRKIPRTRDVCHVAAACTRWCTRIRRQVAESQCHRRHPRRSHAPNRSHRSVRQALPASASSPGRFCEETTRCTAQRHVLSHRWISVRRTTFPITSFIANPNRQNWIQMRYRRRSCLRRRLGEKDFMKILSS